MKRYNAALKGLSH